MELQYVCSSHPRSSSTKLTPHQVWDCRRPNTKICFGNNSSYFGCTGHSGQYRERTWSAGNRKFLKTKSRKSRAELRPEPIKGPETKGTVVGAVALIIGTSIGSGILALPKKTSSAGFVPSAVSMILCWGFLLIEALLLAEVNVGLLRKKLKEEGELEGISIRTMALDTLGEWGGVLVTANYVFLGYTSMVAYISKSSEILSHLINLPPSVSGIVFTTFFTILISFGGTRTTDQVNQWLTASMLGLLVAIEVQSLLSGGWSGFEMAGNWGKAPATIPVIIFSLVYHDVAPVICMYLDGDLRRIRASIILGSVVPLLALLVWDAVVLGLPTQPGDVVDPVELLMRVSWTGVSVMVEAFSLLAVGTSLIGTLLGFSQFFMEQLCNLRWLYPSNQIQKSKGNRELSVLRDESMFFDLQKWWHANKIRFMATAVAVTPPLFVSVSIPDAFSAATDIAGGYCMTLLYGVIPPAMAWAMHTSSCDADDHDGSNKVEINDQKVLLFKAKPALLGVGLFACGIVIEQVLQDLLLWNP